MTVNDLLRSGANAALILACTMAGTYVLLVLIVLISPSSTRGAAAKELLGSHPLSKNGQGSTNGRGGADEQGNGQGA
ncbi:MULTISPECIES: hypothetical protein [unclassified Streptomyces]|uniref:hypothetical protein n=1 Tax=unclassified Streptomyces TaxID=2593676 RepID=UPI0033EFB5FA